MVTTAKPFLRMQRGPDFFLVGAPTALATYLGEHPEIFMARKERHFFGLVEGENALFVPRHDPAALAAAIERLLGDSGLRERMCAANRAKVRELAPSVAARRYIDALEEIVRGVRAA